MARYLIFEDVRETRKYVIEAPDPDAAREHQIEAQEAGDEGAFVTATTISYEMQEIDEAGNVLATFPVVQVE